MSGGIISRNSLRSGVMVLVAGLVIGVALFFGVGRAQATTEPEPPKITEMCKSYRYLYTFEGYDIYRCVATPAWQAITGYCVFDVITLGGYAMPLSPVSEKCPDGGGDDRVNSGHGDHIAAVFVDQDDHAQPDLKLYCVSPELGTYAGQITRELVNGVPTPPEQDTLIKTFDACGHPVNLYKLTTGQLQLNFGPDAEGHTAVMVFSGIPPIDISFYDLNLY